MPDYEEIKDFLPEGLDPVNLPEFSPDFSSVIIVENIPKVGPEKLEKLIGYVLKIYLKFSAKMTAKDIHMPLDESTNLTLGFCFIIFGSAAEADAAMNVTQGFALDKKHSFIVSMYTDLEKFGKISDSFVEEKATPFRARPDPTSWLADAGCRDQFIIRQNRETEIFWANQTEEDPEMVYGGEREKLVGQDTVWCESYVQWSPQGTYLATYHPRGIKLWGGPGFEEQAKFGHNAVQEITFSPCENYIVSYAFPESNDPSFAKEAIIVWDILSGTKIRAFEWKNPLLPNFQVEAKVYVHTQKMIDEGKEAQVNSVRGRINDYNADDYTFDVKEGSKIHEGVRSDMVHPLQDPNRLKWSPDGKYIAKLDIHAQSGTDIISIFELPTMKLLDKKSFQASGAMDFLWSPKSNMFAYWAPAVGNLPASINIVGIPDRADIASRKMYQVQDGRMVWQDQGDYLCVYMTKLQGKKRSYILMFFRVREPEVPVEQIELNEEVIKVSWEPSGDRVAIVSGEGRTHNITFYTMLGVVKQEEPKPVNLPVGMAPPKVKKGPVIKEKRELTQLHVLSGNQATDVIWSPAGNIAALAFYASDCCMFDLHDVDNNLQLASRRHDRGNRLVWDPSGRILASSTITDMKNAKARGNAGDGMIFYTFQGNVIKQVQQDKLFQFTWRPRPKDLLSAEEKKKVVKNLKKYEKEFDKADREKRQELNKETLAKRYNAAAEFFNRLNYNKNLNIGFKSNRIALRDGYDSDDQSNYDVSTVTGETILKQTEINN